MSNCRDCRRLSGRVGFIRNDLGGLRGQLVRASDEAAPRFVALVKAAKAKLAEAETDLAAHQAECVAPLGPRKDHAPRKPKVKTESKRRRVVEIDRDAMAAALSVKPAPAPAGSGRGGGAVTGYCHTCDRPVSGERRYCGPCLARRM